MATVRVRLNSRGVVSVLRSDRVAQDLRSRAVRIATAAGSGMEAESALTSNRARSQVRTASSAARRREAQDKALTRSIDAGR